MQPLSLGNITPKRKGGNEIVNSLHREARILQVAGGNKLQVAGIFFF